MNFTFEVNEKLEVRIYQEGIGFATMYQPTKPNGEAWASKEEAEAWAQEWIALTIAAAEAHATASPDKGTEEIIPEIVE